MSVQNDELDRQMEEAVRGKNEYEEWLGVLAADCFKRGVAVPQAYARQRAWNAHQKAVGEQKKKENARLRRLHALARMIETLQMEQATLLGVPFTRTAPAELEEPDGAFFAEMEADLLRRQESMDVVHATATREQRELALRTADAALAGHNEGEITDSTDV